MPPVDNCAAVIDKDAERGESSVEYALRGDDGPVHIRMNACMQLGPVVI